MRESAANRVTGHPRRKYLYALIGILFAVSVVLVLANVPPLVIFAMSAITIMPIAYFMGISTEELAKRLGPGSGGLVGHTGCERPVHGRHNHRPHR